MSWKKHLLQLVKNVENFLKDNIDTEHDKGGAKFSFQTKLKKLEIDLSKQRIELTSSLLKLKEKEVLKNERCSCVGFCHINHRKHNFYKSKVDIIIEKLKNVEKDKAAVENKETNVKENKVGSRTKKKTFKCKFCKLIFKKMAVLKKHEKQHEQDPDENPETFLTQTSSSQCQIRGKRSKSKRSVKTHKRNQNGNESMNQIKHVKEHDPVSQYQSENEYDDSSTDCSDIDEKEEYTDDTGTSRDDVSRSSSSQFASFEEGEENSGEEEV